MPLKKLPIGTSSFKKIRESNCYYVDKTSMIKAFFELRAKPEVIL